jgi:hypothetical protein
MVLMSHARLLPRVLACVTGALTDRLWRFENGGGRVREDVDLRVHDLVALEEIELYSEVLSAVALADGPLTTEELDVVLGLRQRESAEASA